MEKQQIANALKAARKSAGLTCKEVAQALHKSDKTISAWEHCNGQPDIDTMFALCHVYGIGGLDELLGHIPYGGAGLRVEERDLLAGYRQLTVNSKQIVRTLLEMELAHVAAVKQGETPIRILAKSQKEAHEELHDALNQKTAPEREQFVKVFDQSAAAGYGNFIDDASFTSVSVPSIPHGTEFGIRITGDSMQPAINDGDIVFVKRKATLDVGEIGIFIYEGNAFCKQLTYHNGTYYLHSLNPSYKDIPILSDSVYSVGVVLDHYHES